MHVQITNAQSDHETNISSGGSLRFEAGQLDNSQVDLGARISQLLQSTLCLAREPSIQAAKQHSAEVVFMSLGLMSSFGEKLAFL
ncbi:hypothetical protein JY430_05860 [Stenotrophomonas maltophilia]|nr:hypothetical protein [Stenotrophomonas maltophilia]